MKIIKHQTSKISSLVDIENSPRVTKLIIGENSLIDSFVKIRPVGGSGDVQIGINTEINANCVLYTGNGIKIGNNVLIAAGCVLAPTNHAYRDKNKTIREQRFLLLDNKSSILSIKYPLYQKVNGKTIPKEIQISSFVNGEFVSIILEFIRVDYPKELTTPFKFPDGYNKIKL